MGSAELSAVLWQERQLLERLLAATGHPSLTHSPDPVSPGGPAAVPPHTVGSPGAAAALRDELGLIRLTRDIEMVVVAEDWGLDPAAGLPGLAAGAPSESWRWIFDSHHQALTDLRIRLRHGDRTDTADAGAPDAGSLTSGWPAGRLAGATLPDSLLSHALDTVSEGSLVTDAAQNIVYSNTAFSTITGYDRDELLGRNCRFLQGAGSDPEMLAAMRSRLANGESFRGDILNYRKNGSPFWNALTISPLRDDDGLITHFVSMQRDITAQVAMQEELQFLALHDPLTGLPNRTALEQRLAGTAFPGRERAAVGVIDLDDFKRVNDTFGHEAGDALLQEVARRLQSNLRMTDFLARLGGDEFVILIEGLDGGDARGQIRSVVDRLHRAVETGIPLGDGEVVHLAMSMGLALCTEGPGSHGASLRRADAALYDLKIHKTDRPQWWNLADPDPGAGPSPQRTGTGTAAEPAYGPAADGPPQVPGALAGPPGWPSGGVLSMVMQPVVDLRSGSVDLFESLARVSLEGGAELAPAEFMPLLAAPEIDMLFREGLDQILGQLTRWDSLGLTLRMSINLSPSTLLDPRCTHWVDSALKRHGIAPDRLVLELLETGVITSEAQFKAISGLRALGVRLAMDDLGSGYSSLKRLSVLPFSVVKIDGELTGQLKTEPVATLTLLATLIQMGRDLDWDVIVEGLEDEALTEAVTILQPAYGQGYLLSPPLQPQDVPRWLEDFSPPTVNGGVWTYLGALAYHWQFARLRSPHPGLLDDCPLTGFLERHAGPGQPGTIWHGFQHGSEHRLDADRLDSGTRLVRWLADRVTGEFPGFPEH
jgi:diguanylate cyclase (GGDEF)-like protein/PAS domain S-box-containing protein